MPATYLVNTERFIGLVIVMQVIHAYKPQSTCSCSGYSFNLSKEFFDFTLFAVSNEIVCLLIERLRAFVCTAVKKVQCNLK